MSSPPPPSDRPPGTPPYQPPAGQVPYGYGYPPAGYPGPPYGAGPPYGTRRPARNGLAITSLVLGILALALCWTTFPGIILGILAIIFGVVALVRARADQVSNKGMAIAGLITGLLGLIIGVVLFVAAVRLASDCQDRYGSDITDQELRTCIEDTVGG